MATEITEAAEVKGETQPLQPLLPGLPDDLALRCLARLSNITCAAARATSRSWRAALSPTTLNAIRVSSDLPSTQLLFLSLSSTDPHSQFQWFFIDPLRYRCFPISTPPSSSLSGLISGRAVSKYGQFFLQLLGEVNDVSCINLLRFSRKPSSNLSSSIGGSNSSPSAVTIQSGHLKGQEWTYDIVQVPEREQTTATTHLWSTYLGLGRLLFVACGSSASTMAMSFDGEQWKNLPHLNEPRFMAAGLTFKGQVWVVGGRRVRNSRLEMVESGEVFMPESQKWRLVLGMWPRHLQSLEGVPCLVAVMGRMFGLKMGSNMIVVWDEDRNAWDCLGLIGEKYVDTGFKGRILGVEYEKIWAVIEEPFMVFELETSLNIAIKSVSPSEIVIQTRENIGNLKWRRIDSELQFGGCERALECTLIEV
ncbi:hypothetical protein Sjap_004113 [Stephania japonica]|uniref:F-box domain-containing protein n=1 Tax=Stephania japonica TaxID=461633 RepID=A0AAP0K3X0_9MAGN